MSCELRLELTCGPRRGQGSSQAAWQWAKRQARRGSSWHEPSEHRRRQSEDHSGRIPVYVSQPTSLGCTGTHRLRDDFSKDDDHDRGDNNGADAAAKHRVQENGQGLVDDLICSAPRPIPTSLQLSTHNIAEEKHDQNPVTALAEQAEDLGGIGPLLWIRG